MSRFQVENFEIEKPDNLRKTNYKYLFKKKKNKDKWIYVTLNGAKNKMISNRLCVVNVVILQLF